MAKVKLSEKTRIKNILLPIQPVLVGTTVGDKPNYITIGMVGWLCYDTVSISLGHGQYSNKGIMDNNTFSINQLSEKMVKELDYCGIVSGRNVDKSALFDNFYGKLKNAPMIRECPVSLECQVIQTIKRPVHTVYIGEIIDAYIQEDCMTNGIPDVTKIKPILFAPEKGKGSYSAGYFKLGESFAKAWNVGKDINS